MLVAVLTLIQPIAKIPLEIFSVDLVSPPERANPAPSEERKTVLEKPAPAQEKKIKSMPEKKLPQSLVSPEKDRQPDHLIGDSAFFAPDTRSSADSPELQENPLEPSHDEKERVPSLSAEKDMPEGEKGEATVPGIALFDKETIEKYALKGGPEKKGLSFDSEGFKHRGYMRTLKERIESVWKYPKEAAERGISGDLRVTFIINRDGTLEHAELVRTSGYRSLDEAVLKALKKAFPWWPLPEDYEEDTLKVTGHFIYIYGNTFAL